MVTKIIEVLEPVAPAEGPELHLAPRPTSLDGKIVALFDDNEPNAREMLEDMADLLTARYRIKGIRYRNLNNGTAYDRFGGETVQIPEETLDATARRSDVAVVGVGH